MTNIDEILKNEDTKKVVTEPKKEVVKEEGSVTLTKDEFTALSDRLNRLEKTANKSRLHNFDRLNQENPETIYRLRTIDGKIVIGWSNLLTNKVEVDPQNKKYTEDQKLEVYFEDDTKEIMTLVMFNRRYQFIRLLLVEEKLLRDKEKIAKHGNRVFTLKDLESSKEYMIGERFVN